MRLRPTHRLLGTGLASLALAACASNDHGRLEPVPAERLTALECSFEGPGSLPEGWRAETTHRGDDGEEARWERLEEDSAPSPAHVLSLTDARGHAGDQYNLAWTSTVHATDIDVTVSVRADGGQEDQGGGPAWRIQDVDNYYIARWNPLEHNFRVYSVHDGHRVQLATALVHAELGEWHTIRIRHVGERITCSINGMQLLQTQDSKIMAAGGVGVWTKADATTSFDDLSLRSVGQ